MSDPEFQQWKAARNRALETLDMDYARKTIPDASNDTVRLWALHKARYECTDIDPYLRYCSRSYMLDHGLSRFDGSALLPEGHLPE